MVRKLKPDMQGRKERAEWKAKREVESAVKKRMSKMYIKYGHNYSSF